MLGNAMVGLEETGGFTISHVYSISDWGRLFTKETPSYWYRDSYYKPEAVVRQVARNILYIYAMGRVAIPLEFLIDIP